MWHRALIVPVVLWSLGVPAARGQHVDLSRLEIVEGQAGVSEETGFIHIAGEVRNRSSEWVMKPRLTVELLDASGHPIRVDSILAGVAEDQGQEPHEFIYTERTYIPPGEWVGILSAQLAFASGNANGEREIEEVLKREQAEACAHPSRLEQCRYLSAFLQAGLPSLSPLMLMTGDMHPLRPGPRRTPPWQQVYLVVAADQQGQVTYLTVTPETEQEADQLRAELSDANKRNEKDSVLIQIRQRLAGVDKEGWLVPERFLRTLIIRPEGQPGVLAIRRGPDGFYAFLLQREPKMRSSFDRIMVGYAAKLQVVQVQ